MTDSRFTVLRRLGAGGMGVVYVAQRAAEGTAGPLLALKRMRPGVVDDPKMRARFEREAKVSALLRHPNIVATLEHGVDADGPYLLLEYVRGLSLARLLAALLKENRQLPVDVALSLLADAADGMCSAHEYRHPQLSSQGIVHRDLTPDNILVGYDGVARVLDFGVAWLAGATNLTGTGTVMGKGGFIAPEAYEGHEVDSRSDLFAFGATAYRVLTGVGAFQAPTEAGLMRSVMMTTPPSVRALRPEVPESVAALIAQCLAKSPAARPTMRVMATALRAALNRETRPAVAALLALVSPEPIEAVEAVPERRRTAAVVLNPEPRRRRWPWLVAASMLAGAVMLWALWPAPLAPPPPPSLPVVVLPEIPDASSLVVDAGTANITPLPTPVLVPKAKPRPAVAKATLRIRVKPYADVFLDGRSLGQTPVAAQRLDPGLHAIILVNNDLGIRRSYQVQIRAGEQKSFVVDLSQLTAPR